MEAEADVAPEPVLFRVMMVEDEPLIRYAMADRLREIGAVVVEAASADEAWSYLTNGGVIDVMFTDYRMPGSMTGAELALRTRALYPTLPIILTSGDFQGHGWSEPVLKKPYRVIETATRLAELGLQHKNKNGQGR
jgi:CheY-like chemotaxis protein